MKYEVIVTRKAAASFIVEATNSDEAELKALKEATSCYDFNNDGMPTYEIADLWSIPEQED